MERIYLISFSYKVTASEIPLFGNITMGISGRVTKDTINSLTETILELLSVLDTIEGALIILAMTEIEE